MTWDNFRKPVEYRGVSYGSKEREFVGFETLPASISGCLELAVGGRHAPLAHWQSLGWSVRDSHEVSGSADAYRSYIQGSRGEFSVAKNIYVATHSGWFSCRSTCYLAAGRPVVVQETGFSQQIPTGYGLLAFSTREEAVQAINAIEQDYEGHCQAARELARSHFRSEIVLGDMLKKIGMS